MYDNIKLNQNLKLLSVQALKQLENSSISSCTIVQTLYASPSLMTDVNGLTSGEIIKSFLTRRLGIIVGCFMGIIVFFVLISVLGYLKLKSHRIENAKRQQPIPPEFMSYRHYSMQNEELQRESCHQQQPSIISGTVLGTTTISC